MELIAPTTRPWLEESIRIAKQDPRAELECKLLSYIDPRGGKPNRIQTRDVADRIVKKCNELKSEHSLPDQNYMTISYKGTDSRVIVEKSEMIQKVCVANSFEGVNLKVERKGLYGNGKETYIDPELNSKFTLRKEELSTSEWNREPNATDAFIRVISRKSFLVKSGLFRIDFSMVKESEKPGIPLAKVLKAVPKFELEVEFYKRDTEDTESAIVDQYIYVITELLKAYYHTEFLLTRRQLDQYKSEFESEKISFYDIVTLNRSHLRPLNPHNITRGYTVTIKADGDRAGLYIAKDRRVLKIDKTNKFVWTGISAKTDKYVGTFLDGEYLPLQNKFCIFDMYRIGNQNISNLPLFMDSFEEDTESPKSRLGHAMKFSEHYKEEFTVLPGSTFVIETKEFASGDSENMEECIRNIWNKKNSYGFGVDGLIFTPRDAPIPDDNSPDRSGRVWLRVYKWKPADQNSIDFLIRISNEIVQDTTLNKKCYKAMLFVSRDPTKFTVHPREVMTGELENPRLSSPGRVPTLFLAEVPQNDDAYKINVPVDFLDEHGKRVEDNTIVECSYVIPEQGSSYWNIMRTRYDKTYQYRVDKQQQYGNDIVTANSVWTSIHYPVTIENLTTNLVTSPLTDIDEDVYYRTDVKRRERLFQQVYSFHLGIKNELYEEYVKSGNDLLELAVGQGGDLPRWKSRRVKHIVGMDLSLTNLASQVGAAARYLKDMIKSRPPPALFVQGNMTSYPLFGQGEHTPEEKYLAILRGERDAPTKYLKQFKGLNKFDVVSCQFAMHYACETAESFENFAKNVSEACKDGGYFFGTCSNGTEIYSLLQDRQKNEPYLFIKDDKCAGEYIKLYDGEWNDREFGKSVSVMLESFDRPSIEYLVPFEGVKEIMAKHGMTCILEKGFRDYDHGILPEGATSEQAFSYLNMAFAFKKEEAPKPKEEEVAIEVPEEAKPQEEEAKAEEVKTIEAPAKKKKLVVKKKATISEEDMPIVFSSSEEADNTHKILSNGSAHPIQVDEVKYPTVEHYFAAMKAKEAGDDDSYAKVMKAKTVKQVKAVEKKISDDDADWNEGKQKEYMEIGVRAKYTQNPEPRKALLDTGEKTIGFADERDVFWGVGSSLKRDKINDIGKWRGANELGKLLMKIRSALKEE